MEGGTWSSDSRGYEGVAFSFIFHELLDSNNLLASTFC